MTDSSTTPTDRPATGLGTAPVEASVGSDFGIDTTSLSTGEAIRNYGRRIRGGELGPLPAVLGLVILLIIFTALSGNFFTLNNIANLMSQGAGETIIAMGIVPVLLLGEIDLSAGTASGLTAALLALHLNKGGVTGGLQLAMGDTVFFGFVIILLVAAALAAWQRIWIGALFSFGGALILVLGLSPNPWLEMALAVFVGAGIGSLTGFLVSKIGMPSFVVTLALFIAWYGVILLLIGNDGELSIRQSAVLFDVANGNLNTLGSWIMFVIGGGGYAAVVIWRHFGRLRKGLVAQPTTLISIKVGVVLVVGAAATYLLTLNRSPNPTLTTIAGVPYVVPIILVLLVIGTFVLDRTRYGRHIYAVGGNREAARRAGIGVDKIRMSVFVICSAIAAIGAIVYSSKIGEVDGNAGNGNTLLFAVGAAVIGGTSLFGGRGRIRDAVLGGAVLATVQNGLALLGFQAAQVNIITGLVLLIAATVDALSRRRAQAR
jgi:D-xylose transport system permease protein